MKTRRFKTPDELRTLFLRAGVDLKKPATAYCQSGGRATVTVFAMELAGGDKVSAYYAGWAEWGNADDVPITAERLSSSTPRPVEKHSPTTNRVWQRDSER